MPCRANGSTPALARTDSGVSGHWSASPRPSRWPPYRPGHRNPYTAAVRTGAEGHPGAPGARACGSCVRTAYAEVIGLAGAQQAAAHTARNRGLRRRARYLVNGAGFVCANDGPAHASGVARPIRSEVYYLISATIWPLIIGAGC